MAEYKVKYSSTEDKVTKTLTKMDEKRIEQLYMLLERMEKEHNAEATAALRWGIFELESRQEA